MASFPSGNHSPKSEIDTLSAELEETITRISYATDDLCLERPVAARIADIRQQLEKVLEIVFWMDADVAQETLDVVAPIVQARKLTITDLPSLADQLMQIYVSLPVTDTHVPAVASKQVELDTHPYADLEGDMKSRFPGLVGDLQMAIVEHRISPSVANTERIKVCLEKLIELLPPADRYDEMRAVLASARNSRKYTPSLLQMTLTEITREWANLG